MIIPQKRFFFILSGGFILSALGFFVEGLAFLQGLLYLGLLIVCTMDFFSIIKKKNLTVKRLYEKYLSIGADNPIKIQIENRTTKYGSFTIRDGYPTDFLVAEDTMKIEIEGLSYATVQYYVKPIKKGDYKFRYIIMRVSGRFGLIARQYKMPIFSKAIVYPNIIELKKFMKMISRNRLEQIGYRRKLPGGESEFDFLREYQPGDNYRKVNWKATARRSFPIVQVDQEERNRNIIAILDTGRMMTTRYNFLSKLDYAVDASLILAAAAGQKNDHFGLLTFAEKVNTYLAPTRKQGVLTTILAALYKATASFSSTNYFASYRFLKPRLRKNSIIFVFSELYNDIVSADLVRFLKMLSANHRINFVSFEEIESLAEGKNHYEITRWALQQQQILEKETIIKDLSLHGIHTIRVNADNIKQQVVNAYLSS